MAANCLLFVAFDRTLERIKLQERENSKYFFVLTFYKPPLLIMRANGLELSRVANAFAAPEPG